MDTVKKLEDILTSLKANHTNKDLDKIDTDIEDLEAKIASMNKSRQARVMGPKPDEDGMAGAAKTVNSWLAPKMPEREPMPGGGLDDKTAYDSKG